MQGSDIAESANVQRLRQAGIPVRDRSQRPTIWARLRSAPVVSTAVKRDNPEVAAARARLIPGGAPRRDAGRIDAAEMVDRGRRDPWQDHDHQSDCVHAGGCSPRSDRDNGGIINAYGTNTRMGSGDWMVVEADESDGSFLRPPAIIVVVTNWIRNISIIGAPLRR